MKQRAEGFPPLPHRKIPAGMLSSGTGLTGSQHTSFKIGSLQHPVYPARGGGKPFQKPAIATDYPSENPMQIRSITGQTAGTETLLYDRHQYDYTMQITS